ncbi:MAG: hypothetical protein ACRCXC_04435 [Legionella sp.]
MKNQFIDQKVFNNLEVPMQKLMELNIKMMQNFSYMKPLGNYSPLYATVCRTGVNELYLEKN